MAVFEVDGQEYEILEPRGRKGRKATNWLISSMGQITGDESEVGIDRLTGLIDDADFLDIHLAAFVGKDAAKKIDEDATTGEMLTGILQIVEEVFESFAVPEVEAAVKNSNDTQETEE